MTVQLNMLPVTRNLCLWIEKDKHTWQCGNIRIVECDVESADYPLWFVQIKHRGRWRFAYCAQRPWGYGSASQAKRGVSKWTQIHFYDHGPQSETYRRMNEAYSFC